MSVVAASRAEAGGGTVEFPGVASKTASLVLLGALATIGFAVWLGRCYARTNR